MCGVIGVSLRVADIDLIRSVLTESMIRGKHATGVSYVKNGVIHTVKHGVPVDRFLQKFDLNEMINEDGGVYMIGHIRYSTSDIRYNQPFQGDGISIVHNGVISQDSADTWKYSTNTSNDSELVLKSIEAGNDPLTDFRPASMAVCTISDDKTLTCFRNEARPLWFNDLEGGVVFTSTKDISLRSGLSNPTKCDMYKKYTYSANKLVDKMVDISYNVSDLQ